MATRDRFAAWAVAAALTAGACAAQTNAVEDAALASAAGATNGIAGRWEGRWCSGRVLGGALACNLTSVSNAVYDAHFGATVFGVFPYRYDVRLHMSNGSEHVVFSGSKDLGFARGGLYRFSGTIKDGELDCRFESSVYDGEFQLKKSP